MNKNVVWVTGIAAVLAMGVLAISVSATEASPGQEDKPSVPRYSEICAHGHNGFDCKTPQYLENISELQKKMTGLEQRVAILEAR